MWTADKILADLKWILLSPPMCLTPEDFFLSPNVLSHWYHRDQDFFHYWEQHPKELEACFTNLNPLLGKYFEALWTFYFTHSPHFEVLLAHEQIKVEGLTLGEIDYVVRDVLTDEVFHLEVALKYYMSRENSQDPKTWIGPNENDHLDRKLERLINHQLPMYENVREMINKGKYKGSFGILKGFLIPHSIDKNPIFPSLYPLQNRPKVIWLNFKDFISAYLEGRFQLLDKKDWLMSREVYPEYEVFDFDELKIRLIKAFTEYPKRVYLVRKLTSDEVNTCHFIFIVQ